MKTASLVVLALLAACTVRTGLPYAPDYAVATVAPVAPTQPGAVTPAPAPMAVAAPVPVAAPNEDQHWFQPDDYVIGQGELGNGGWQYVSLAKLQQAPSDATKGEGKFFDLKAAKEVWTAHYWRSRPATQDDLKLGAMVMCFDWDKRDNVRHAPTSKERSRTSGAWWMGRITDTSDLYKGAVTVVTYSCSPDTLRVVYR